MGLLTALKRVTVGGGSLDSKAASSAVRSPEVSLRARSSQGRLSSGVQSVGRPEWWRQRIGHDGVIFPQEEQLALMEEMRRTLPVVDRAINALVQLSGTVSFEGSKTAAKEWNDWAQKAKVNQHETSFRRWWASHMDSVLHYGKGVSELVHNRARNDLAAFVNLDARSVYFRTTPNPLEVQPLQRQIGVSGYVDLPKERTLISTHTSQTDRIHGESMFRACPFVAQAQRTVENATQQDWLRRGVPPIHINVEFSDAMPDPEGEIAGEVIDELKSEWDKVMGQAKTPADAKVVDYFTSGKVTIRTVGAEGTPLVVQETYRCFAEQLIAVTGLPSWFLGMHWQTQQRLASQQAELLIANIGSLRELIWPELLAAVEMRATLLGRKGRVKPVWSPITLHDLTEQMRAKAWEEQARQRRINNYSVLWHLGMIDQQRASEFIDPNMGPIARPLEVPPMVPGSGNIVLGPDDGYGE
jgi:hypothetical protein